MSARIDIAFHSAPAERPAKNTTAGAGSLTSHTSTGGSTPMVEASEWRRYGPIREEPRGLRPPYDGHDSAIARGPKPGESTDMWRARVRLNRLAALYAPLTGLEISHYEDSQLSALCENEDHVIAVVAALLHRARAATPLAEGGHTPNGGEQ